MSDRELQQIQKLQFTDIQLANDLLKTFLRENLPYKLAEVQIRPLAVSLNSLNGFLTTEDGQRLFFKTHVEPKSIIDEYYNSKILAEAGYPVMQPLHSSTEWGKQLLIYECIEYPSLFDLTRTLERDEKRNFDAIVAIQHKADEALLEIYFKTLQYSPASQDQDAPIHQLFSHRLTGGRFDTFYRNKMISLPGQKIPFEQLSRLQWVINGMVFNDTLSDLVQQAIETLKPGKMDIPTIVGHGDAHNGNVFVDQDHQTLIYFDPAFAGRHSPLLDLAKPIFHNVFAIWMYFPEEVAKQLSIDVDIQDNTIVVNHNFTPSTVRIEFLRSKLRKTLNPIVEQLKTKGWLSADWKKYLKLALFCCPFLTRNLADAKIFSPQISLLGLVMSVAMGSSSQDQESLIDSELNLAIGNR